MSLKNAKKFATNVESKESDEFLGEPDDKRLVIQMHKPMWAQLRRMAFDMNISMAELCRRGIALLLEQSKKHSSE